MAIENLAEALMPRGSDFTHQHCIVNVAVGLIRWEMLDTYPQNWRILYASPIGP